MESSADYIGIEKERCNEKVACHVVQQIHNQKLIVIELTS